ncbi:isocitrate lyase/PEP mutase family protein [Gordonia rhizosphera]|uniref:2-methylisocitrate lyase n=1 Tax=Gordonia rhizosphera NBRC 16068 TaxID=1108045 RepID=K6WAC8_9ACTN|nr:isocitrate lyase/PEP mutase family protein [Gordonia rhizosphera]GAB89157.1 methylisocitrate lyase [Gordonia rhizosphera NBRC 16068]
MSDLLGARSPVRSRLRAALEGGRPVVAPGAYDSLTARLAESAGFEAVYMTGFGTAASLLGRPDVGLITASEMTDNARRMVAAIDVPLIADADTGYGNAINVIRTMQDYERAGVAAIQLEDQVAPKRCGHMAGKQVVPAGEMVAKIAAAVDARTDPDLLIIARTDAIAVTGVEDAIDRARRYADAGADLLFVEAPGSVNEIAMVATALSDCRLVFNWAEGGRTPGLTMDEITELGFALILYPIGALFSAVRAIQGYYEVLARDGVPTAVLGDLPAFDDVTDFLGLPEVNELSDRYADR